MCCNKPIDDIQPGDLVWATNPDTGETELKEVVQIFRGETYEWVHISIGNEEIVCTPGHPFYLPDRGWVTADELCIGDRLVTLDGKNVKITSIFYENLDSSETTYNFEVEGFHTYYVGETNVLVHNKCQKNTGSYEIFTDDNKVYVGKGSEKRMMRSVARLREQGYSVTDGNWSWTSSMNDKTAFIDEYMKMSKYNFDFGKSMINKIMSPGFKYFNEIL